MKIYQRPTTEVQKCSDYRHQGILLPTDNTNRHTTDKPTPNITTDQGLRSSNTKNICHTIHQQQTCSRYSLHWQVRLRGGGCCWYISSAHKLQWFSWCPPWIWIPIEGVRFVLQDPFSNGRKCWFQVGDRLLLLFVPSIPKQAMRLDTRNFNLQFIKQLLPGGRNGAPSNLVVIITVPFGIIFEQSKHLIIKPKGNFGMGAHVQ